MNYGFTINVNGNSLQEMKKIETALQSLGIKASDAAGKVNRSFDQTAEKLEDIGRKIAIVFSVEKIVEFGKHILETTAEFEGFNNRIKFASLNAYDAQRNIGFLREEVEKLHIPMRQAYEGFSEMQAGLVGTGIEGSRLRDLFEGISSAAATLHLPEYSLQRTLYDLKEIGEIGINQRIVRSLSTALPGINKIVKDTFGKSFQELEKSGISGGAFLEKLGPALSKHFAGGLENFGASLQARLADAKNSFTQTILDLGDKLKPIFIDILNDIRSVFNSAPVQLFINNIEGIVTVLAKVGAMWVVYKGLVYGAAAAEAVYTAATGLMAIATYTASFGVEGLIYSMESLGITISSLGTAIAAFSLTILIQEFYDLTKQIDEALDKLTGFKAATAQYENNTEGFKNLVSRAGDTSMTKTEKGELLTDLLSKRGEIADEITKSLKPTIDRARKSEDDFYKTHKKTWWSENQLKGTHDIISEFGNKLKSAGDQVSTLDKVISTLKKQGIKPKIGGGPVGGGVTGGLHGSHLSGAEGGLDRARIVNLKIDTVMRVYEAKGPELKKHAEEAVDFIIRAANNLSESQSGTM